MLTYEAPAIAKDFLKLHTNKGVHITPLNTYLQELMKQVEDQMLSAAKALDFEQAAKLRDQLLELKGEKPQAEQIQKKRRRTRESTRHH